MFFNLLLSEWTKLRSTASFWWTTALVFVLSLGFSALTAGLSDPEAQPGLGPTPASVVSSFTSFGVAVVLIQAIMVITTEYRFGLAGSNFMATPSRWPVMVAKLVLYGMIAALLALVVIVASYLLTSALLPDALQETFKPFEDEAGRRMLWAVPLLTFVAVMFVQGLGMLIRQTAGAVAISIIWLLGFDQMLRLIPKIGEDIARAMPFHNMTMFQGGQPYEGTDWNEWSSFGVFLLWALVAWIGGLVLTLKRDA